MNSTLIVIVIAACALVGGGAYHWITTQGYKLEIQNLQGRLQAEQEKVAKQTTKLAEVEAENVILKSSNGECKQAVDMANQLLKDIKRERDDNFKKWQQEKNNATIQAKQHQETAAWLSEQVAEAGKVCESTDRLFSQYLERRTPTQ